MWRKTISAAVSTVRYDDPRLLCCNVDTDNGTLFVLNVYMPYQSADNHEDYSMYLGKISAMVSEVDTTILQQKSLSRHVPREHALLVLLCRKMRISMLMV